MLPASWRRLDRSARRAYQITTTFASRIKASVLGKDLLIKVLRDENPTIAAGAESEAGLTEVGQTLGNVTQACKIIRTAGTVLPVETVRQGH